MVNMIQYTIFTLLTAVTILFFQGIGNVSVPIAMAADSQNSQEIKTHLTEVQKALDNNDIQGAKTHLSAAMGLLQNQQEVQTHLTEVQKALDNNDIQGAKTHLSVAMGLL
jgi:cobalamin biosynthesis protein CobD/CbiB